MVFIYLFVLYILSKVLLSIVRVFPSLGVFYSLLTVLGIFRETNDETLSKVLRRRTPPFVSSSDRPKNLTPLRQLSDSSGSVDLRSPFP